MDMVEMMMDRGRDLRIAGSVSVIGNALRLRRARLDGAAKPAR